MKKKTLVPLIIFLLGICLVGLIVYKTDTHEKAERHTTAQFNAATYGERIKNEIITGIEITNTLEQILISEDGEINHFDTIAENIISDSIASIELAPDGIVTDIYDLLTEYQLYIVGEQGVRVKHVLLGLPEASLDDIDIVYSHPQALAQCKKYLEQHPDWKITKTENTAGAAKKVHEEKDKSHAAIASRAAGELYGLSVLAENICYNEKNVTRFIVVSAKPIYEKSAAKVSVCFELPHTSGTLYNMLSHFIYNGLNMTKIESRPIAGKTWEYRFFVDFEGNLEDSAVKNALRGLEAEANRMRVLGNYGQQEEQ